MKIKVTFATIPNFFEIKQKHLSLNSIGNTTPPHYIAYRILSCIQSRGVGE